MMFPGGIRCIPGYPQRVGGTQRPGDAPVRRCHPGGGLCRAEPRPPKRTAPTPRAQRGPPPAASAPPPRGGGGRWRRGRPRGSPRRRKPGPVPSRSAPGCHFKVNKAAEVRAGDGLSGGTGLRNRYRNRGRGGARVPVAAGVVLGGSFRGAPSVRPRRYRSAARSGLGGRHQEGFRVVGLSGGGTRRDTPPPYPLRAPCSYGRVGAEVGTGLRPRRARCCVCGGVDPRHSCGGFGDGGRAVSNSSFGRGEVRTHLGTGTAAVWGTARPPSPPPARHPLGLPREVRVSHAAPAGGGRSVRGVVPCLWDCGFVNRGGGKLWVAEPWRRPPLPPPWRCPPPPLPFSLRCCRAVAANTCS